MGIFDFMSNNKSEECGSTADKKNENNGSLLKGVPMKIAQKTIQGSGELFRKIYSAKINVVNDFSDVKPDWSFIDSGSLRDELARLDRVIEFEKNKYKNNKTQEALQRVIDAIRQQIIIHSLLPDNLAAAVNMVREYGFDDPFAIHGIACLQAHAAGDEATAMAEAKKYCAANGGDMEHPLVGFYTAKSFFKDEKYEITIDLLKKVVVAYPDNMEVHKMLCVSHKMLGQDKAAAMEEAIVNMFA